MNYLNSAVPYRILNLAGKNSAAPQSNIDVIPLDQLRYVTIHRGNPHQHYHR